MQIMSEWFGSSTAKLSRKSIELKRWRVTERRWKRKVDSCSSFDLTLILRPSSEIKEVADLLIAPKFSEAIGWKSKEFGKFAYLSDFREAASSAAAPGVEYFVTYDCANGFLFNIIIINYY